MDRLGPDPGALTNSPNQCNQVHSEPAAGGRSKKERPMEPVLRTSKKFKRFIEDEQPENDFHELLLATAAMVLGFLLAVMLLCF